MKIISVPYYCIFKSECALPTYRSGNIRYGHNVDIRFHPGDEMMTSRYASGPSGFEYEGIILFDAYNVILVPKTQIQQYAYTTDRVPYETWRRLVDMYDTMPFYNEIQGRPNFQTVNSVDSVRSAWPGGDDRLECPGLAQPCQDDQVSQLSRFCLARLAWASSRRSIQSILPGQPDRTESTELAGWARPSRPA